ncbi:MAG TPA: hypothetical protein VHX61_06760 [Rhizomicrobium sp.]|jgi:hypothetical protein|nr:hypothetical protein [Rhizomicrobium sp.]
MEDHEWNALPERTKLDWLRSAVDRMLGAEMQQMMVLSERLQRVEGEQVRLAEALDLEARRSRRASRAH